MDSETAQVTPFELTHALINAAKSRGNTSVIHGEVIDVVVDHHSKDDKRGGVTVKYRPAVTDDDDLESSVKHVNADKVVLAMGPWTVKGQ
jgi:glycine/D-amino acid oxidase-like deaminating enzyme